MDHRPRARGAVGADMFRNLSIALVFPAVLLVAIALAALNPGALSLDFGAGAVEYDKPFALALVFAAGWFLGVLGMGLAVLRLWLDRRRLRTALRLAEGEVKALRRVPVHHAD
jgi:uncharacterized membrane protein YciS (DUF1049 family)